MRRKIPEMKFVWCPVIDCGFVIAYPETRRGVHDVAAEYLTHNVLAHWEILELCHTSFVEKWSPDKIEQTVGPLFKSGA